MDNARLALRLCGFLTKDVMFGLEGGRLYGRVEVLEGHQMDGSKCYVVKLLKKIGRKKEDNAKEGNSWDLSYFMKSPTNFRDLIKPSFSLSQLITGLCSGHF